MAVIIAANRLPVTIRHGSAGITLQDSVGGVATGLRHVLQAGGRWIGWPGPTASLSPEERVEVDRQLVARGCLPVHLTPAEVRGFYLGYANGTIWPLFHYLPQQVPLRPGPWDEYERVNRRFAEAIAKEWKSGDLVWIHDYQLMRVAHHLRQLCPGARIGFFLHIPFPAFEIFRVLPARRQLLEGILAADLIGFHTRAYADHFIEATTRLLGCRPRADGRLDWRGRAPEIGVYPMGIDVARFEQSSEESPFGTAPRVSAAAPHPVQTLVGIDRLDYTKGIPRRLLAYQHLLTRHPELRERVCLIQVAVPSRTGVRAYNRIRRHVDALVGRINGSFGTPGWTPVQYLYRGFSQADLVGLYRQADVMLVTPVRDGMNLVAKEFIASRTDGDGVLVLSEFTGAADELVEALQVNPFDIESSAEAYLRALTMPRQERRSRMKALRARVKMLPVDEWADVFLAALESRPAPGGLPPDALTPDAQVRSEIDLLRDADLLLLLDYDGTLVSFAPTPDQATPDAQLAQLLAGLAARPRTAVHLISGRPRATLEGWFGQLPIGLHAEHGAWSRGPGETRWERHELLRPVPYDSLLALLKRYNDLTPGAIIERKSSGLAWHYRLAHADIAQSHVEALITEVRKRFPAERVDILRGHQVVEFRPAGIHKGLVVERLLEERTDTPTVVAIGDDMTDEDMFTALPADGLGVQVGPRPSRARLRLRDVTACRRFLAQLLEAGAMVPAP